MTFADFKRLQALHALLGNQRLLAGVPAERVAALRGDYRALMRSWWALSPDKRREYQDLWARQWLEVANGE